MAALRIVGAAALVLAVTWWVTRPGPVESSAKTASAHARPDDTGPDETRSGIRWQAARGSTEHKPGSVPDPAPQLANMDTEEATVAAYAADKYRLLLDDLRDMRAEDVEKLRRGLLQRELLTGAIKAAREANDPAKSAEILRQEESLAQVEGQIHALLHPTDHATYQLLKDADLELFQLDEYARGISNVAPLGTADRNAILKTKLAYKARYRQLLQDSGLGRDNLSAAERDYAYTVTARALEDYRRSYLLEVRQLLADDEQYLLLSNYENTEFTAELAKLQSMANGGEHKEVVFANTR